MQQKFQNKKNEEKKNAFELCKLLLLGELKTVYWKNYMY